MKNYQSIFVLVVFIFTANLLAQTEQNNLGAIVQKDEAKTLFGDIIQQVELQASVVDSLCKLGDDFISFAIVDSHAVVFSGVKPTMVFDGVFVNKEKVTTKYSKSVVLELLGNDLTGKVQLQIRKEKFTVQYNDKVMEYGEPCPPLCK